MAVHYFLICIPCKQFIKLQQLRIVNEGLPYPLPIEGLIIDHQILTEGLLQLKSEATQQWMISQLPFIEEFLKVHANHPLILKDDTSDYFWHPEFEGYTQWKEVITSISDELFLPKNIVEDLGIKDWAVAEAHLKTLKVMLFEELELKEYKSTFNKLTTNQQ